MRALGPALIALALGACAHAREPYDGDFAYCRRTAMPPATTSFSDTSLLQTGAARPAQHELATGSSESQFSACMRSRFQERFPGVPYPLDP